MPTLIVVVTVQVVQRWMNFAIANPARQLFFTVVTREEKYKAKESGRRRRLSRLRRVVRLDLRHACKDWV